MCYFPPGTSKWNKIEHRTFSHITQNWRGRPLVSHEIIVNLIANTTTRFRPEAMIGLTIGAWSGLPIEEPLMWMAVSYASVIVYEVIKIWLALGTRAPVAFFGAQL